MFAYDTDKVVSAYSYVSGALLAIANCGVPGLVVRSTYVRNLLSKLLGEIPKQQVGVPQLIMLKH